MKSTAGLILTIALVAGGTSVAGAQGGSRQHMQHMQYMPQTQSGPSPMAPGVAHAQDSRELVRLPAPMQEHMLGNMRDHLMTLNDIIGDVGDNKFDEAAKLAEQRLGMSSLALHDAAHMAPFMPQQMQDLGTSMHHAASRLAIVLQDAAVTQTDESRRDVERALHEVTSACTGCHASYRIR